MDIEKAIEWQKAFKKRYNGMPQEVVYACDFTIAALEELQQYRQIGTVDELKNKIVELERWHTDRTNEKIRNPFANTSTLICHNCDHKDEYIEELEYSIEEYEKIGTLDECREAREKMKPMELHHTRINKEPVKTRDSVCPSCLGVIRTALNEFPNYCSNCGQALKWGD